MYKTVVPLGTAVKQLSWYYPHTSFVTHSLLLLSMLIMCYSLSGMRKCARELLESGVME